MKGTRLPGVTRSLTILHCLNKDREWENTVHVIEVHNTINHVRTSKYACKLSIRSVSIRIYIYMLHFSALMAYSHCTGTGPGPVQGPNGKYNTLWKCSHWLETGAGANTYCASPVPSPSPVPVQCE